SNFSKPRPMGSIQRWQPLQNGSVVCCEKRWRVVELGSTVGGLMLRFGGGGGGDWQKSCSCTNLPRRTGEVWSACDGRARMRACVSTPLRCVGSTDTFWNWLPETPVKP